MRILLDTHAFLWFIAGDAKLTAYARQQIESPENRRWLSVASLWEMAIKTSLGKLELTLPFPQLVADQITGNGIEILGIEPEHLDAVTSLPFHHRDPFDRMIIAQGQVEGVPIVSKDAAFDVYPIKRLWRQDKS